MKPIKLGKKDRKLLFGLTLVTQAVSSVAAAFSLLFRKKSMGNFFVFLGALTAILSAALLKEDRDERRGKAPAAGKTEKPSPEKAASPAEEPTVSTPDDETPAPAGTVGEDAASDADAGEDVEELLREAEPDEDLGSISIDMDKLNEAIEQLRNA